MTNLRSALAAALDGYSSYWRGNGSPVGLWNADPNRFNSWQRWY
ncbi:hypothetical protein [Kitasatospora sp. MMS16-BH015]|nr:hypothetical protein [Kitasatospora sp. MMS16-BH015]